MFANIVKCFNDLILEGVDYTEWVRFPPPTHHSPCSLILLSNLNFQQMLVLKMKPHVTGKIIPVLDTQCIVRDTKNKYSYTLF